MKNKKPSGNAIDIADAFMKIFGFTRVETHKGKDNSEKEIDNPAPSNDDVCE